MPKRSIRNGEPQAHAVIKSDGVHHVPSYVCDRGESIDRGAKALGMRALGWRDSADLAAAEIHELGGKSYLLALAK